MDIIQHDSLSAYEAEYRRVRAALVADGTTLNAWLLAKGINRQTAYQALKGQSHGPKARAIRAMILRAVLAQAMAA